MIGAEVNLMKGKKIFYIGALIFFIGILLFITSRYFGLDIQIHNYSFKGENGQWVATYEAHSRGYFYEVNNRLKYNGNNEYASTLTYTGDLAKLSAAKKVEYRLSTGEGGTSTFDGTPSRSVFRRSSKGNGVKILPDDYIELTVTISGNSPEVIKLYKSEN
jgi:hypothetical protein